MGQSAMGLGVAPGRPVCEPGQTGRPPARIDGARLAAVKEQQILVSLAEQLAEAQFRQGDQVRSQRLWKEAALLELDPERLTHVLYAGAGCPDRPALVQLDQNWCHRQPGPAGRGSVGSWLRHTVFRQPRSGGCGLAACPEALNQ